MVYSKITLAFPEKDELLFRKKYFTDSIVQYQIAFVIVIILYGAFGYLDFKMFPEYAKLFTIIRFVFVIPLLSLVLVLSFTKIFHKIWQLLSLVSFIATGTGIAVMTMFVPENYAYYSGLMLIFSGGYFFIKLRFFFSFNCRLVYTYNF